MSYSAIDSILDDWSKRNGLYIHKQYHDVEVRSVEIVSPQGSRFQLWVDEPNQNSDIGVHIWDMKKRRKDYYTSVTFFENVLEVAYQQAQDWF